MKDEVTEKLVTQFVGLIAKMYDYRELGIVCGLAISYEQKRFVIKEKKGERD